MDSKTQESEQKTKDAEISKLQKDLKVLNEKKQEFG